jgi:hypothetical protein
MARGLPAISSAQVGPNQAPCPLTLRIQQTVDVANGVIFQLYSTIFIIRGWIAEAALQSKEAGDSSQQRVCRQHLCAWGLSFIKSKII